MSRWKRAWRAARIAILLTAAALVLVVGVSWWRSTGWSECVLYRGPLRSVRDFDPTLNERTPTVCRGEWTIGHHDGVVYIRRDPHVTDVAVRFNRPRWEILSEPIARPLPPAAQLPIAGKGQIQTRWITPPPNTISNFPPLTAARPPVSAPKTWWQRAGFAATSTPDKYIDGFSLQAPHWAFIVLPLLIVIGFGVRWVQGLRRHHAGQCERCGYDLRGLHVGVACPECGAASTGS